MSLSKEETAKIIKDYQMHSNDTASPQVQIAMLSHRLTQLNEHFKTNKKDHHSRRGLMKLVGRRRKLLSYLNKNNADEYKTLISKLGIRK
ncbi:MAG: 30S ribosomal protein S15 [Zetaproteobacteria bacterium]|nr:30S ribosomal protein S15 [Pseudobdellovibrionaceae bacterium]|tara:strand:+ start:187 stop:456 length:270 start_codon:yes stop_codon:yes gene_type:complete